MQMYRGNLNQWISECTQVLKSNLPDEEILAKLQFRYTCPAREKGIYLPQWLWDSCFHAIVYRWFDPKMAWEEIQSLIVHQVQDGEDQGMIPHMSYLAENNDIKDQKLFNNPDRSIITQPPLIAIAALEVHKRNPNIEILSTLYQALKTYHDWFDRRRDLENDHLVGIIHPWESGWDASQRWDEFMNVDGQQIGLIDALDKKRKILTDLILAYNCDITKIAASPDGFYVKPADFNAIRAADLDALADIGQIIGAGKQEIKSLETRAFDIKQAIREKMVQVKNDRLLVYDLSGQSQKIKSTDSAAKFVLLFGNCVTEQQAELLRNELMGKIGYFNTPYQVPTTPTDNATFDGGEYWRGNVWLPVNWLIYRGLLNYDFVEEAKKITQNSLDLVTENGYREFFNPLTGQGGKFSGSDCPKNQSWSTIVLDMLMTSLSANKKLL